MKKKNLLIGVLALAVVLILPACRPSTAVPATPTNDPRPVLTGAAQTAEARLTQMVQLTPTVTLAPPTNTPAPTATEMPTPAVSPSPVGQVAPTATTAPVATGADRSVLASETIPDGTRFAPGATFTKSWRMLNNGASTWTRGYELVHVSDSLLGASSPAAITVDVPPNQMADFAVSMTAPNTPGTYRGYWRMKNPAGTFFGDLIWVEIVVAGEGTPVGTPAGTPSTPSPTQAATSTPSGSSAVSNVYLSLSPATVTEACPYTFAVSGFFTLSQPATVTYQLEAGSDTPGFQFNLPGAQTFSFPAGENQVSYNIQLSNSASGWFRLHITAPQDVISSQVSFSLTCQ